jgi:ABC-type spermidine/putrescine transport system permease subunit II
MTPAAPVSFLAAETVHWIKVQKPVFDLVGVVLYSLGLAAICALVALVLGSAFGIALIVRTRRHEASLADRGLRLLEPQG